MLSGAGCHEPFIVRAYLIGEVASFSRAVPVCAKLILIVLLAFSAFAQYPVFALCANVAGVIDDTCDDYELGSGVTPSADLAARNPLRVASGTPVESIFAAARDIRLAVAAGRAPPRL